MNKRGRLVNGTELLVNVLWRGARRCTSAWRPSANELSANEPERRECLKAQRKQSAEKRAGETSQERLQRLEARREQRVNRRARRGDNAWRLNANAVLASAFEKQAEGRRALKRFSRTSSCQTGSRDQPGKNPSLTRICQAHSETSPDTARRLLSTK